MLSGGLLGGIGGVGVGVAIRLLLLDPDNNENFGAEFYNMCCGNTADSSGIAACNRYKGIVGGARGARGDDRQCMEKSCDETVFKNIGNRPSSPLVLDETVYDLSLQAHHLSNLVYEWPIPNTTSFTASYSSYTMDILGSWRSKNLVDQALVAKSNGRCFGIFRGTLGISSDPVAINDWISNFTPLDGGTAGKAWSCGGCGCCEGRANFVATLYNEFWEEFRETLLSCTQSCSDSTDCVVIGGIPKAVLLLQSLPIWIPGSLLLASPLPCSNHAPTSKSCEFIATSIHTTMPILAFSGMILLQCFLGLVLIPLDTLSFSGKIPLVWQRNQVWTQTILLTIYTIFLLEFTG